MIAQPLADAVPAPLADAPKMPPSVRSHWASTVRRRWPVVAAAPLVAWTRNRLQQLCAAGTDAVAVDVDGDAVPESALAAVRRVVAEYGLRVDDGAGDRLGFGPQRSWRDRSPFHCPDYWHLSTRPELERVAAFRRRVLQRQAQGPVVLFVGQRHRTTPSINYVARALRERGDVATCAIFVVEPPPPDVYDEAIHVQGSLGLLYAVLRDLPSLPVFVQAHAQWAFLGLWIKRANRRLRVCQDIYDWTGLFAPPDRADTFVAQGVYSLPDIALSCWSEQAALRRLDAVFYKNGGESMRDLLGPQASRAISLFPAPPRAWQRPVRPRQDPAGGPRLVFAGRIKGRDSAPAVFGDLHYLPLARELTAQGCTLDIYWQVRDGHGALIPEYTEYAAEAAWNPALRLCDGLPTERLIAELNGRYDFGLLLFHFEPDLAVGPGHIASALASKLFTYLAAGLPLLVSAELQYMARLVETWGVGLVVTRDELPALGDRLRAVDMAALHAGVRAAQRRYYAEADLPKILAALFPQRQLDACAGR